MSELKPDKGGVQMAGGSTRRIWVAGVAFLLIAVCVYLGGWGWKSELKVPLIDGSTVTVAPGVHLIGGLGPAAAYAIETNDGLVLIDAGLEDDAQALKSELTGLGLDWKKVRAIFLTHVHGDHCAGAQRLRAETGARIYAGKADVPLLQAGGPRTAFFSTFKMPDHSPHPTTIDVSLAGKEVVPVGNVRVQTLDTPGHTAGSTCYLVERNGLRILFSGDVIFRLGDKPLGTYTTYLAPKYGGNARAYLASLRALRALPVPDLLLPGHPSASGGPHSPRLGEQRWQEMLDQGMREMERLIARYDADGGIFLDGNPKRLLPELYYFGDYQGNAVYGFFAASQFFLVDAPGGTGLRQFLHRQMKELGLAPTDPAVILLTACGELETAGLAELTAGGKTQVVAAAEAIEAIQKRCAPGTTLISVDELKRKEWFSVQTIPLRGRGESPIAFLLQWADQSVLISGRMVTAIDQETVPALLADLEKSPQNPSDFINSMRQLVKLRPNLWLPAVPVDSPNAKLFDNAWPAIVEKNYRAASGMLQGP